MVPQLKISSNVIERLNKIYEPCTGRLYGVVYENTLMVLTFTVETATENEASLAEDLQLNMPAEIDLCGVVAIGRSEKAILFAFKDIDVTDNPLLLKCSTGGSDLEAYFYMHQKLEPAGDLEVLNEEAIWQQFAYIRLEASYPIVSEREGLLDSLLEARKNIASGKVGFHLPGNNVYLLGGGVDLGGEFTVDLSSGCGNTYEGSGNSNRSSGKRVLYRGNVVPAHMFLTSTTNKLIEGSIKCAPVLQHIKRSFNCLSFDLRIDALSLVSRSIGSTQLYEILVESFCRNLKLTERSLTQHFINESNLTKLPELMHFKPQGCGHLFTICYPAETTNDETLEYRRSLHKSLALDMVRPYFRKANALKFQSDEDNNKLLLNPHEAIQSSGVPGGKISTVSGLYAYHHYMQDQFDDNGWGCAYRSLQTIVSWYRLQGYSDISVPSHREIQKCLVTIGDKPSGFIGSKQWIGSTEVGFVLETLLGISIKVLCASTGEEMTSMAPSLAYHFQTQGTPVMIGGGVLAHTILGVDYNEATGDVKFLILDPHYTGAEILTTILSKGWCGWKGPEFWKKDAFYNMCLPQRPICI